MYSDPISELLVKVKNAQMANNNDTSVEYSKMKENILEILKSKGFISDFKVNEKRKNIKSLKVFLKYTNEDKPVIKGFKRVSKPSLRVYKSVDDIKLELNGFAVSVYSTNKGLMTARQARENKLGGEYLFYIW